jgi:hypothetical protein
MVLWPLLWPRAGARRAYAGLAGLALAAAVGIALWLQINSPWSPRHPRVAEPLYVVDAGARRAWRVSPFEPDSWTRAVLTADGGKIGRMDFPSFRKPVWAASARPVSVAAPPIDITRAQDGTITVRAGIDPGAALRLDLSCDTVVASTSVDGKPAPILGEPGKWSHIDWQAARGVALAFKPVGHGVLDLRYAEYIPSWPASAAPLPPMPADLMAWDRSGSTVATGKLRSTW